MTLPLFFYSYSVSKVEASSNFIYSSVKPCSISAFLYDSENEVWTFVGSDDVSSATSVVKLSTEVSLLESSVVFVSSGDSVFSEGSEVSSVVSVVVSGSGSGSV